MSYRIRVSGYRLDRAGRLVRDERRLDVSARLRQRASQRVHVVRPGEADLRVRPQREPEAPHGPADRKD